MSVGWEVYDVGTVGNDTSNNAMVIVGIVLGILGALVVGAGLALVVMMHLRKKKIGQEPLTRFPPNREQLILSLFAFLHIPSSAGHFLCTLSRPFSKHREPLIDDALARSLKHRRGFFANGRLQTR